jgi:alpha-glucosidase (family GH31 glycosyl hydrolase)
MKKLFLLLFISTFSFAQNENRKFESFKKGNNSLEIKTSDGLYILKLYSEKIAETTFLPNGETFNPNSHAVVLVPKEGISTITESKNSIGLLSKGIRVIVQKSPFQITYYNQENVVLSEKLGYTKNDSTETLDFNISKDEVLFGGGARALGMNRRGNRLKLYNKANFGYQTRSETMNFCIPLVLSSKIYAVHFDNSAIGFLDLDSKKDNTLAYETISGRKTYQVIIGNSWEDLIGNYTDLTGKQPMPARWTLGNFSSRFGYHTQEQVEKTIDRYIADEIPVDAIILDLYWFGKTIQGTMGNLDWDKDNFPTPTKMISNLKEKGVKTVLITEPFVLTTSNRWKEAVDNNVLAIDKTGKPGTFDFYFGNTGIIDVFNPKGKSWFWSIYKNLIQQGVGGWWGDLGEPEMLPEKLFLGEKKADVVHNIYGHNWAKSVFEGYQKDFPNQRPFILMRAGYSGSQHYGMIPWSGDVSRSWGGLQSQPEIALQMGIQGIGYMHSDLGGFGGDYFDNELYTRWLQYGVFQPIFRPHAQEEVASEPVYKDIVTKAKAKKQIELRYQMLPYNYTLAFENNQKGLPLMRPLFFEESNNTVLLNSSDAYLWGNNFLVYPITTAEITSMAVYFPKNNNWFDLYTDKKHEAGSSDTISVSADNIPVFVRGGSFIPRIKTIQNTTQYSLSNFDLHYYFDEKTPNSEGKLYNDDGLTANAFEKGEYELLHFYGQAKSNKLEITLNSEIGKKYTSTEKNGTLIIHALPFKVKKATLNGENIAFNTKDKTIEIPIAWKKGKVKLEIEY